MARGFVGSRRMKPFFSNVWSCECTLEVEVRPTSSQISRPEGGYPRSLTALRPNPRVGRCVVGWVWRVAVYGLDTGAGLGGAGTAFFGLVGLGRRAAEKANAWST